MRKMDRLESIRMRQKPMVHEGPDLVSDTTFLLGVIDKLEAALRKRILDAGQRALGGVREEDEPRPSPVTLSFHGANTMHVADAENYTRMKAAIARAKLDA
uniref:Uncharacterized protein n=1 Tax=viral metagenome TaxID=1070528 RepID=A0A6M3LQZ2_9ZZZZ